MTAAPSPVLHAHLEQPDQAPRQHRYVVQGWVTSRAPVVRAEVLGPAAAPLGLRARPDVVRAMPDAPHATGFFGVAGREHVADDALHLRFHTDAGAHDRSFPLVPELPALADLRRRKLERVYPLLRCIHCGGAFPEGGFGAESDSITCASCGHTFDCSQGCFDLLTDEQRQRYALGMDANVSSNHYDPRVTQFIHENAGGLLLDCGAGVPTHPYENVVNLEVVAYRTTDVLGDGTRLPFADASFDGVLSLAVLEHVRDPFACAREMLRVLKPGGQVLAIVPLLAPVHAYPDHYYNMTSAGLVNLFGPALEVLETSVPHSGHPVWALLWMLRSWADGLDGEARRHFTNLRVSDLLGEAPEYLERDFVTALPESKRFELASTTLLHGKKR